MNKNLGLYYKIRKSNQFKLHEDKIFKDKLQNFKNNYFNQNTSAMSAYQELINYVCLEFLNSMTLPKPKPNEPDQIKRLKYYNLVQYGHLMNSSNAYTSLKFVSLISQSMGIFNKIVDSRVLDAANTNKHRYKNINFDNVKWGQTLKGYNEFISHLSKHPNATITSQCMINEQMLHKKKRKHAKKTSWYQGDLSNVEHKLNLKKNITLETINDMNKQRDVKSIRQTMKTINDFRGLVARFEELSGKRYKEKSLRLKDIDKYLKKLKDKKAKIRIRQSEKFNKKLSKKYRRFG